MATRWPPGHAEARQKRAHIARGEPAETTTMWVLSGRVCPAKAIHIKDCRRPRTLLGGTTGNYPKYHKVWEDGALRAVSTAGM